MAQIGLPKCFSPSRPLTSRTGSGRFRLPAGVQIPSTFTKVSPKGNHCYVKTAEEEKKTTGGILLPASAARKPTTGVVESCGDGKLGKKTHKFTVKPGDAVLYSKFGFMYTEVELQGGNYILIREDDIIGTLPRADATADDVPDLTPLQDRVLVKVDSASEVTSGGVVIPDSAKEKPLSGTVVRVGAGKQNEQGEIEPCKLKPGERILYFKYAGDNMETTTGEKYVVLHENDILSKT